jgi:hypothetical protein
MPKQISVTKSLAAASVSNIAQSQSLAAAGAFTLNGSAATGGVATLDTQRRVLISSAGNDSGIKFTINGANGAGATISETLTGSNGGTVATAQDFDTVTGASSSGATASTVQIGTNTVGSTQWFVPDYWNNPTIIQMATELVSGAANWTIEVTDDDPKALIAPFQPGYNQTPPVPNPYGWTGLTGISGSASAVIATPVQAWRLTINSGQGVVAAKAQQAGQAY